MQIAQDAEIPTSTLKILPRIIACESGFNPEAKHINNAHYLKNGTFVATTTDYGLGQINSNHWDDAKKLGYDVFTEKGNIGYMVHLVKQNGLADYSASRSCWQNS